MSGCFTASSPLTSSYSAAAERDPGGGEGVVSSVRQLEQNVGVAGLIQRTPADEIAASQLE
jgi:hypothetical protein